MEGVVLCLKLVVVFITRHKCYYIAFFTIASFGGQLHQNFVRLLWSILMQCRSTTVVHDSSGSSWISSQH